MSRVFVATERGLNRPVVVKVLRPDLAADVNRDRFRREIMLAAQLQHPLIVTVLSAGQHRELLWYTMPFIEGESLREAIHRGKPASAREAIRVLHDVLDALAYAHARGVIHRDIKPGNILRHGNHSLVTDFGVAKALSAALPASGTTSAGMAIGTPAYMAPEQLAADPKADHRMDLYAVGLLVYELLTGTQAFAESSPQETMAAQLTRMPAPLSQVRPDIPVPLSALVTRMLAKNPDLRPQSAAAALAEVDALATPTETMARPTMARFVPQSGARRAVAAIVLIAAAGVAGYFALPRPKQTVTSAAGPNPSPPASAAPIAASPSAQVARPTPTPSGVPRADSMRRSSGSSEKTTSTKQASGVTAPSVASKTIDPARGKTGAATKQPPTASKAAVTAARPGMPNRRVALLPVRVNTPRENIGGAAAAILDSLRKSVAAAGYAVATDAELVQILSLPNDGNALRRWADAARIGAIVRIEVTTRADEFVASIHVLDVWRSQTLQEREAADLDKPLDLLAAVRDVTRSLDRVSWRSRADPRRVLLFEVENQTGADSLSVAAKVIGDSLRAAIARQGAVAVPLDSVMNSTRDVMERRQVAIRAGAGALVSAAIFRHRRDSLMIRLAIRDMSDERTLPNVEARLGMADLGASIAEAAGRLAAKLAEQLAAINWGPRAIQ